MNSNFRPNHPNKKHLKQSHYAGVADFRDDGWEDPTDLDLDAEKEQRRNRRLRRQKREQRRKGRPDADDYWN